MTTMILGDASAVELLNGRYQVGEILGEGSIGLVYAAYDTKLGIDVAVKVMKDEAAQNVGIVERFAREATLATRMMSPHVARVLGVAITDSGAPCIVYERLVGETLAARIRREGTLSLALTAQVVRQTARALARAHMLGVVHCDVKPDNIFLADEPGGRVTVKVLDFGIAEVMSMRAANTNEVAGTPEYMAPEVLFGAQMADARADLYALGAVAYECLTGLPPFPGDHVDDVLWQLRYGSRASLADVRPDLHEEVEEWMTRALHAQPFWRFASAKELADALDEVVRVAPTRVDYNRAA